MFGIYYPDMYIICLFNMCKKFNIGQVSHCFVFVLSYIREMIDVTKICVQLTVAEFYDVLLSLQM